nr:hypothetical protein [Hyphomonas sp. Mor2]
MPVSPFDIAIILISSVACIYCMVLSRRLRALQNTRNGLGATIKALSDSISAVSATTDETRYHAGELAVRLAHLIEEAKQACERVETLTHDLNQAPPPVRQPVYQSPPQAAPVTQETADAMRDALTLSNERLREITDLMHRMKHMSEESAAAAQRDIQPHDTRPVQLRSRMKVV